MCLFVLNLSQLFMKFWHGPEQGDANFIFIWLLIEVEYFLVNSGFASSNFSRLKFKFDLQRANNEAFLQIDYDHENVLNSIQLCPGRSGYIA